MAHWAVPARSHLPARNFGSADLPQPAQRSLIELVLRQILLHQELRSGRLLFRRDESTESCRGRNIRPSQHRRGAGRPPLQIRRKLVSSAPPVSSLSLSAVRLTPARSPAFGRSLAVSRSWSGIRAFVFR